MNIEYGKVVSFHYTLFNAGNASEAGEADSGQSEEVEIESSGDGDPMLYLHGHRGLLEALQEGLEGHSAGEDVVVDVPAERAYGMRKPESTHRVPIKHVVGTAARKRLSPGQVIQVNTPEGERDATVVKAGKFNVDIDTNHPLAGKNLKFVITIKEVRDATPDELAHGHAHGPGGHQH